MKELIWLTIYPLFIIFVCFFVCFQFWFRGQDFGSDCSSSRLFLLLDNMSLVVRKPVFWVSDQVRHKPGCTTTEDSKRLEISDLDRRGIVLPMQRKRYREADLRLCFRICKKPVFS